MSNYDFNNISPFEFEELVRDLLQKKMKVDFESFPEGPDEGVDLWHHKLKGDIIVQCKRYRNFSNLKRDLKKEYPKIKKLNPKKYIIATSVSLTLKNKKEIQKIFGKYIRLTSQIIGKNDLNNLLGKYKEIEKQHFKLWLTSISVLEMLLNNDIFVRSYGNIERLKKKILLCVKSRSFNEALESLKNNGYVIISGIPGIGKTTLAEILLFHYLNDDYEVFEISQDINEAEKIYSKLKKQVFYYDDFLGRNFLQEGLNKNEDQRLINFIEMIKRDPNKRLIMTTREYILKQAKTKYEIFDNIDESKCVVDVSKYTKLVKGKILYNHLYYNSIKDSDINVLLFEKKYNQIINHKSYNPRVIEYITKDFNAEVSGFSIFDSFINNLNNPVKIWQHAFENQISQISRSLLLVMATMNEPILIDKLELAINSFLGYDIDSIVLKSSIKELESTFISTIKDYSHKQLIDYANPSVKDFLINYLRNNEQIITKLAKSFLFIDQFFDVFAVKKQKYSEVILLNDNLQNIFFENISKKYSSLLDSSSRKIFYSDLERFYFQEIKTSNIQRLYFITKFFGSNNSRIVEFINRELNHIALMDLVEFDDKKSFVDILDILNNKVVIDIEKIFEYFVNSVNDLDDTNALAELLKLEIFNKPKFITKLDNVDFKRELYKIVSVKTSELVGEDNYFIEEALAKIKVINEILPIDLDKAYDDLRNLIQSEPDDEDQQPDEDDYSDESDELTENDAHLIDYMFKTLQ